MTSDYTIAVFVGDILDVQVGIRLNQSAHISKIHTLDIGHQLVIMKQKSASQSIVYLQLVWTSNSSSWSLLNFGNQLSSLSMLILCKPESKGLQLQYLFLYRVVKIIPYIYCFSSRENSLLSDRSTK